VAFSADGKTLVSGGGLGEFPQSGEVKVWDVGSGRHRLDLKGHTYSVWSVAMSADGARIASGAGWFREPGEIKVWDAQTGQQLLNVKGHANGVSGLAFSPDGRSLFSRDFRGDTRAWDSKTGQPLPLPDPPPEFRASAQTADGRLFAHPEGSVIRLIPSADAEETAWRKTLTRPDPGWHWDEVLRQDEAGNHLAVAFHLGQLLRHRPLEEPWHRLAAEAYHRAGQPRLAALHLACALWQDRGFDPLPSDPLGRQHGESSARAGRWAEAADHFTRSLRSNPRDASTLHDLLLAQLGAGQKEASQRTCVRILDYLTEFRDHPWSDSLHRVCALLTLTEGDSRRHLALAEQRVQKERSAFNLFLLGAARYRAGRFEQAVASLEEAIKRRQTKEWGDERLFLALARQRLGKRQEDNQGLEKAINLLERHPASNWRRQVYLQILRKEAEELIRGEKGK
jgi:tetratricopeptide (TPR) repeat protein